MTFDRKLLPATFGPWFSRFDAPTEVQRRGIPPIRAGKDVLLCSATASGKTEAFAAPAAELVRETGGASATALFVAPTRALCNDLKRRLEGPMERVDVSFGRYTGEHKERAGGQLPSVAVVTPEALDSLITRRPQVLAACRFVVLDEVHVLDGTPRGDQVRILLQRLENATDARPQRIAASATVDRPDELAARYLADPEVIVVQGVRRLLARPFQGTSPEALGAHLNELAGHGFRKLLVFTKSRNDVESYAAKLAGRTKFGAAAFGHHGSLAQRQRERTERLFHDAPAAVCFATLTLEMGIDIGTVDYVVLAGLPSDVASLLQRIGRGGRRGDTTRCGYAYDVPAEKFLFETFFKAGLAGELCAPPYAFRPSVLVQQALGMACAGGFLEPEDLRRAVPPEVENELGSRAADELLAELALRGDLERSGAKRLVPSESVEKRWSRGLLHANLAEEPGLDVVDRLTGDVVGRVQRLSGDELELGGRGRKAVHASDGRVLTDAAGAEGPARFRPTGSPSVSMALARRVVEELGVEPGRIGLIDLVDRYVLLHGLGTVGSAWLAFLFEASGKHPGLSRVSPYAATLPRPISELPVATPAKAAGFVRKKASALAKLARAGPFHAHLPEALRDASARRACGLDEVLETYEAARLVILPEPSPDTKEVLRDL